MKLRLFPACLSLVAAAVLSYLAYYLAASRFDQQSLLVAIGTFVATTLTLVPALAAKMDSPRMGTNLRVWCNLMLVVTLIANLCFAGFGVAMPFYVILMALLLLLHVGVVWKLTDIKDV
jgi:hypothetical protein